MYLSMDRPSACQTSTNFGAVDLESEFYLKAGGSAWGIWEVSLLGIFLYLTNKDENRIVIYSTEYGHKRKQFITFAGCGKLS
jgi:hypothetical protein